MEEICLSSGSDTSESEIEIIYSKSPKEIIILENEPKRRRLENSKRSKSITYTSNETTPKKQNIDKNKVLISKFSPKIVGVCSAKKIDKNQLSIQEYFLSLLKKSYVIKNLKYEEDVNLSFSDQLFSNFSCWETNISSNYLNLFLSWIKISNSKSIELIELLRLLEIFFKTASCIDQESAKNEFNEFLVRFSQCINTISLKIDTKKGPVYLEKLHCTKRCVNNFFLKIFKLLDHSNFKIFSIFYKIIYDIYRVYSLFLFKVKLKYINDPISLINCFKPDEKFIYEIIDDFKRCIFLFEKNTEFVLINI